MSGLGTSFGFGACTNFPRDLVNSDCILVITTIAAGWILPFLLLLQGALLELLPPVLIVLGAVTVRNAFVMLPRGPMPAVFVRING